MSTFRARVLHRDLAPEWGFGVPPNRAPLAHDMIAALDVRRDAVFHRLPWSTFPKVPTHLVMKRQTVFLLAAGVLSAAPACTSQDSLLDARGSGGDSQTNGGTATN